MSSTDTYLLALDVGTSALKVGAFGIDGSFAASAEREQPIALVAGRAEQSPAQTWKLLTQATCEALAAIPPSRVAAIALSNQRGTVVAIDREHRPLT